MVAENAVDLAVFGDRLERTQRELQRRQIGALIVGASSDLLYLIGREGHLSERLSVLVLPSEGDAAYVVPTLEAPLLEDRGDLLRVHPWEETEAPSAVVARLLDRAGQQKIAVGDQLWSVFLLRLQEAIPGAQWVAGGEVLRPLRSIKDGREIELLKEAARRTDDAWAEFISQPLSGQTERQALARLLDLTHGRGLAPAFGGCGSGPNGASPHHETGDRVIERGDAVVFDWGGRLEGYHSDVTRTLCVGEPGDELRRVYDIVLRANEAALDAVRPGVACEAVDAAARNLIDEEGYGAAFIHRVGHGLGLDVHEEPYLVSGNTEPMLSGMVFSDEPGIYLEGRFGVRIEDAVLCTDVGAERLNEATRELTIVE